MRIGSRIMNRSWASRPHLIGVFYRGKLRSIQKKKKTKVKETISTKSPLIVYQLTAVSTESLEEEQ